MSHRCHTMTRLGCSLPYRCCTFSHQEDSDSCEVENRDLWAERRLELRTLLGRGRVFGLFSGVVLGSSPGSLAPPTTRHCKLPAFWVVCADVKVLRLVRRSEKLPPAARSNLKSRLSTMSLLILSDCAVVLMAFWHSRRFELLRLLIPISQVSLVEIPLGPSEDLV